MMTNEKIKNSSELEFAVFCIENVAAKLGVDAERVYQAFVCVMKSRTCKYVSAQRKHWLCCILKEVKHYDSNSDFASEKI